MSRTSRRDFAKTIAILPLGALAQERQAESPSLHMIKAQHGQHLGADDLERIGKTLQEYATLLDRLRAFPLKNSDEPDVTFSSLTKRW